MDTKNVKVTMGITVDIEDVPCEISNFLANASAVDIESLPDMLNNCVQSIENLSYQQDIEKIEKSLNELTLLFNLSVKFADRLGMTVDLLKSYKTALEAVNKPNEQEKVLDTHPEIKQEYDDLPF